MIVKVRPEDAHASSARKRTSRSWRWLEAAKTNTPTSRSDRLSISKKAMSIKESLRTKPKAVLGLRSIRLAAEGRSLGREEKNQASNGGLLKC